MRLRPLPGDTRMLGVLAAVAVGLFLAALTYRLGEILMKRSLLFAAIAAAALAMSACSGVTKLITAPAGDTTMGQAIMQHIELCDRRYQGALGAGVTGSFDINCKAQPRVAPLSELGPLNSPPN